MLTCVGYGVPSPSVTWRKDGGTLPTSRVITRVEQLTEAGRIFTRGALEICSTAFEDAGTYRCTVSNLIGSSSATINLTVESTDGKLKYSFNQEEHIVCATIASQLYNLLLIVILNRIVAVCEKLKTIVAD